MIPKECIRKESRTINESLSAEYLLICCEVTDENGARTSYSVTVKLKDITTTVDADTVNDITSLRSEADRIFSAVLNGTVTPVSLRDVISDLTAE